MEPTTKTDQIERLRAIADDLECLTEDDLTLLAGVTPGTAEAWRKRRQGPAYIRIGNRVLYPKSAVAEYLATLSAARSHPSVLKGLS